MSQSNSVFTSNGIQKLFCNNCGKYNHTFNHCIEPITSIGIICVRKNKDNGEYEYLMICRKDSLGFIDFMRGKYNIHNKNHLLQIINEMTLEEKNKLLDKDFETLWTEIWHNNYGIKYRNEKFNSEQKFNLLKKRSDNEDHISLYSLIKESKTKWREPEWELPKGRRNYKEKDIDTALREFEEETGIHRSNIKIIQNIVPYDEIFTGSNLKSYRQRYFIATLDREVSLDNYQMCEVSNIKWIPYSKINDTIREYSLEKIEILKKVNKVLETFRLIF